MLSVRTSKGNVQWKLGSLDETAEMIFSYGYCAEFARTLYLKNSNLTISYYECEDGTPDHFFCSDGIYWYDILGKHSIDTIPKYRSVVEDIELDEVDQHIGDFNDCSLAESIISEYLERYF